VQPREAAQINRKAINRLARDFRASILFQGAEKLSEPQLSGKQRCQFLSRQTARRF
jgi:hypothetical protein